MHCDSTRSILIIQFPELFAFLGGSVSSAKADEQEGTTAEGGVYVTCFAVAGKTRELNTVFTGLFGFSTHFEQTTLSVSSDTHSKNDCDC